MSAETVRQLTVSHEVSGVVLKLLQQKETLTKMLDGLKGTFRTCRINWKVSKIVFDFYSVEEKKEFVKKEIVIKANEETHVIQTPKIEEAAKRTKVFHLTIREFPPPLKLEDLESWIGETVGGFPEVHVAPLITVGDHWISGARARVTTVSEWRPPEGDNEASIAGTKVTLAWLTPEGLKRAIENRRQRGWEKKEQTGTTEVKAAEKTVVARYELGLIREEDFMREFQKNRTRYAMKWRQRSTMWIVVGESAAKEVMGIKPTVGDDWPFETAKPEFFYRLNLKVKGQERGESSMMEERKPNMSDTAEEENTNKEPAGSSKAGEEENAGSTEEMCEMESEMTGEQLEGKNMEIAMEISEEGSTLLSKSEKTPKGKGTKRAMADRSPEQAQTRTDGENDGELDKGREWGTLSPISSIEGDLSETELDPGESQGKEVRENPEKK
jgi:hypothetical protein